MPTTKVGYVNGSDLLLKVGGKAIGHCTTHTTTFNTETKDRSVKPVASASISAVARRLYCSWMDCACATPLPQPHSDNSRGMIPIK